MYKTREKSIELSEEQKEIVRQISSGDASDIAEILDVHSSYVRKVFKGQRKSEAVWQVASQLIGLKNQLKAIYQQ